MLEMMGSDNPKPIQEIKINKIWSYIRYRSEETGVQNVPLYLSHQFQFFLSNGSYCVVFSKNELTEGCYKAQAMIKQTSGFLLCRPTTVYRQLLPTPRLSLMFCCPWISMFLPLFSDGTPHSVDNSFLNLSSFGCLDDRDLVICEYPSYVDS